MINTSSQVIESCIVCKSHSGPNPRYQHRILSLGVPFLVVRIDLIGPLPTAIGGHKYIVLVIGHLTKWVEANSMASASAKFTALFLLRNIFSCHGSPTVILSDNGLKSTSKGVNELSNLFGAFQTFADPYYPVINGTFK